SSRPTSKSNRPSPSQSAMTLVKDRAAVARQWLRRLDGEFRLAPRWTRANEKASPAWVAYDQVGVPVAIPVHQVRTRSAAEQRRPGRLAELGALARERRGWVISESAIEV